MTRKIVKRSTLKKKKKKSGLRKVSGFRSESYRYSKSSRRISYLHSLNLSSKNESLICFVKKSKFFLGWIGTIIGKIRDANDKRKRDKAMRAKRSAGIENC